MMLSSIASLVGCSEAALRLLISVLIGNRHTSRGRRENRMIFFSLSIFFPRYTHCEFSSTYRFSSFHLAAFPIVIIYRQFLHNNSSITPRRTHTLFFVSGFLICLFNYGWQGNFHTIN